MCANEAATAAPVARSPELNVHESSHKIHGAVKCLRQGVVVIVREDVFRPAMINPRRPGQATRRRVSYGLARLIVHVDTRQ